jgi:ABC-type Zn uptake system ZnuABC Zn-binding protein ZnuA
MYCFTANIAGDLADVRMIVPPNVSAPTFEPKDPDLRKIAAADLVIESGFGYERWMDQLIARGILKPNAARILVSRGAGPGIPGLPGDPNTPPADIPADPTQPPDPHIWLDPLMAIKQLKNICDALMARDPVHADDYLANENRYEASLRDLDDELGRATVDLPHRRLFDPSHAFSYFFSRYEFPVAQSAAQADALVRLKGAAPVSGTTSLNEHPARTVTLDPMDSGTASVDFYENIMRANAAALREGLSK